MLKVTSKLTCLPTRLRRLAVPDKPADIHIDTAYGDSPPPHVFWDLERHNKRQELSATFLDVRGRPEEPETKKQSSGWNLL